MSKSQYRVAMVGLGFGGAAQAQQTRAAVVVVDLELRGAGDIEGTQQSGNLDFKIANLATDGIILQAARDVAIKTLADDPHLQKQENILLNKKLSAIMKGEFQWGRVG